ncbi:MAG: alpha/beta hydrolase [Gammaproteobacteria bacterium]
MNLTKPLIPPLLALTVLAACGQTAPVVNTETAKGVFQKNALNPLTLVQLPIPNTPREAVSERGVISVPVNRSSSSTQTIDVEFFRFKRLPEANPDTPPIFLLRGGPGYPGLGDAVENEAFYKRNIQRYTRLSDLIIVGQRGFGTSGDLSCPAAPVSSLEEVNTMTQSQARYRRTSEVCRDKYLDKGVDLSGYNIKEMAADVADIASSLGYKQIQLKGNSFGSFWGIAVLRHHADLVKRATFSALEGPDHTFDRPSAVKAAFTNLAEAAANSERYADRIPDEGLIAAYQSVIDKANSIPVATSFVSKENGDTINLSIDGDGFRRFFYGVTTLPVFRYTMSDWPDDLLNIIEGDLSDMAPRLYQYMTGTNADNAAEEIIECSSGISPGRREEIDQDSSRDYVSPPALFDKQTCAIWGEAIIDMDRSEFKTPVPTVLIQGTWDISTPYEDAKTVQTLFSNHRFITVHGGSHGAIFESEEADPEFSDALDHWYVTGEQDLLPQNIRLPTMNWNGGE